MLIRNIKHRPAAGDTSNLPANMHPLLKRIYTQRGVTRPEQLEVSLARLLPADHLSGMNNVVRLLKQSLEHRERILIVGDFDADGATSTVLALRVLRAMGAAEVRYIVPNRFEFGYGLTPEIVDFSLPLNPDLIITVDNGIASVEGVATAHSYGIKVIITDHHLPGEELPAADAIVNPNLPGDAFPSKALAGVGVIFYVMLSL